MKRIKKLSVILTFLVVCFIGMAELSANSEAEKVSHPVADEMIGSSGITWVPKVNYKQLVLTVSRPDGTVFSKTIESGSTPRVDLSEIIGSSFSDTDGSYIYQLLVIPGVERKIRREQEQFLTPELTNVSQKALTQSGSFVVQGGAIVFADVTEFVPELGASQTQDELSKVQDICYVDDLIVDGSLCVGTDCTCNYSFGFDTFVLKENNLRIFFDDTSTSGSFPRNDWRIIINDSANGGASYFGVEDSTAGRRVFTLEAGAPSHSLYVDDGGRVGFGTSTPVLDLHAVSGNTPSLRLEQDGSSGFTPQTWDVAGNETNFFIRDATNGSKLPFKIKPGAPNNSLFIASDGNIGMETTSPDFSLDIERNGENAGIRLYRVGGAEFKLNVTSALAQIGSISSHKLNFVTGNSARMTIDTTGNVGIGQTSPSYLLHLSGGAYSDGSDWFPASSRELKENIESLSVEEAMNAVEALNPVKYNYKKHKEEARVGFIAEDVPELVAINGRKNLSPMDILGVLTKVVQEQQKTISELKQEIAEFKKKK